MIPMPGGSHVWLATGATDMRKAFDGLAPLVQDLLGRRRVGLNPTKRRSDHAGQNVE